MLIKKIIRNEWIKAYLGAFCVLFLIFTVANLVSELLRNTAPIMDVLFNYFLEIPFWMGKMLPVSCLIATLFSLNKLQRKSELVAIFSSGFKRKNYILTLMQLGLGVCIIQFFMGGIIAPYFKSLRPKLMKGQEIHFRNNKAKGIKFSSFDQNKFWFRGKNYIGVFSGFDKKNKGLSDISLYYFQPQLGLISKIIKSKEALFQKDDSWELTNGQVFLKLEQNMFPSTFKFSQRIENLGVTENDFLRIENDITKMNILDMFLYIKNLKNLGIESSEYEIMFYEKITMAILCILFTLMPLNALFSPNQRGMSFGQSVAFVFAFVLIFNFIHSFFLVMGSNGKINPVLASFASILILVSYLAYRLNKNKVII